MNDEKRPSLDELVSEMSHSIKNILNKLEGGAYMVNSGLSRDRPEILKSGWSILEENIDRVSDLLMNILLYSKEWAPEPETCSPNKILDDVFDVIRGRIRGSKTELSKESAPEVEECLLDPKAIHMALLNIYGYVIGSLRPGDRGSRDVRLELAAEEGDEGVRFKVLVFGQGVSTVIHETAFEELYKREPMDATFGLRVAKKVVEAHRGTLTLESMPGEGLIFTVYVPANREARA
ncbi:MAG: HAMP domain-containing histidine kinase [Deltaproteobacteria bacterium]|nr:HAMP domain-containing histidine kinase [Deltaproteobacteria bacterium]